MDDEIEPVPGRTEGGKRRGDGGLVLDVAGQGDIRADRAGEGFDPLPEGIALIGEGEPGAVGGKGARDAPRDGTLIGDPHHQAALAFHQCSGVVHRARPAGGSDCR